MEKEQEDAYNDAIQEYRSASLARMPKGSGNNHNDLAQVLPRRQISNYFVQFRKVHSANDPFINTSIVLNIFSYLLLICLMI